MASFADIPQNGLNTKYTNVAGDKEYWNGIFASLKPLIKSEDNEALGGGKEYWNGILAFLKPLIQSGGALGGDKEYWNKIFASLKPITQSQDKEALATIKDVVS